MSRHRRQRNRRNLVTAHKTEQYEKLVRALRDGGITATPAFGVSVGDEIDLSMGGGQTPIKGKVRATSIKGDVLTVTVGVVLAVALDWVEVEVTL